MYLFNTGKAFIRFSEINLYLQALNELPTDERHIKVPLLCPTHVDSKQVFEHFLFMCVTRADLSGVPLIFMNIFDVIILQYDSHEKHYV